MLTLTVHLDSPRPMTEQIVTGLRQLIAQGELQPSDVLPPVRQLAADLGVNLNTVARAYRSLEAAGLVTVVRGRGTQVISAVETSGVEDAERVRRLLTNTIADAKLAGISEERLKQDFIEVLATFFPRTI